MDYAEVKTFTLPAAFTAEFVLEVPLVVEIEVYKELSK